MKNFLLNYRLNSWETDNTDTCGRGRSELFFVAGSSNAVSAQHASQILRTGFAVNTGVYLGTSCKATCLGNTTLIVLPELWWWHWFLYLRYLILSKEIKISIWFPVMTVPMAISVDVAFKKWPNSVACRKFRKRTFWKQQENCVCLLWCPKLQLRLLW